jgi:hypothetical protein
MKPTVLPVRVKPAGFIYKYNLVVLRHNIKRYSFRTLNHAWIQKKSLTCIIIIIIIIIIIHKFSACLICFRITHTKKT